MPAAHGRSSAVFLNAYNVSAFLSSFDSTKTVDTAEVTTFGSTSKAYVTGLRDGTITLGGYFDGGAGALDEIMAMALSDTRVSYGTDLITGSDAISAYNTVGNTADASMPISGFANSIEFGSATVIRTAAKAVTTTTVKNYLFSWYQQNIDSSRPVFTGIINTFLYTSVHGAVLPPTIGLTPINIELITGAIYKCSTILPGLNGTFNLGFYRGTAGYTSQGFLLSGMSVNEITTTAAANPILSICEEGAGAIGNRCTVAQVIDTSYQITGSISDAVQVTAEFQADGTGVSGAYRGVVLAPLAAYSNGQNTTGFDGGAASSNGLVANLHVLSAGGSTTVKIQHSTDNSSWTDLVTFTTGAVQFSEHKTTTGTVHRYLRVNVVTDGLPVMVVTAARK